MNEWRRVIYPDRHIPFLIEGRQVSRKKMKRIGRKFRREERITWRERREDKRKPNQFLHEVKKMAVYTLRLYFFMIDLSIHLSWPPSPSGVCTLQNALSSRMQDTHSICLSTHPATYTPLQLLRTILPCDKNREETREKQNKERKRKRKKRRQVGILTASNCWESWLPLISSCFFWISYFLNSLCFFSYAWLISCIRRTHAWQQEKRDLSSSSSWSESTWRQAIKYLIRGHPHREEEETKGREKEKTRAEETFRPSQQERE